MSQVKALVDAIDAFITGSKADGTWSAIKASCIMAGWNNLNGALTPLVGAAPTNFNFVSGDYDRKTGLIGDATTKYLDSNRNNNTDPQNNNHNAVYVTSLGTNARAYIGCGDGNANGTNQILQNSGMLTRSRGLPSNSLTNDGATATVGLWAMSRGNSGFYARRMNKTDSTGTYNSATPLNVNILVFARGTPASLNLVSNGRIAFYSIGEDLNLTQLDSRVTALTTAINGAIP